MYWLLTSLNMAVLCHCESVRTGDVLRAVRSGAQSLADVQAATGAALKCGGCTEAVCDAIVCELLVDKSSIIRTHQETAHAG
jgi:NAD(P)H-nitrite reductase large subunit